MLARWGSFSVGLGLTLAPLVLGYGSAAAILHEVAMGVLVCVAALAAVQWPAARFLLAAPAAWLLAAGRAASERDRAAAELVAGALLLALCAVPSGAARRVPRRGHVGARA